MKFFSIIFLSLVIGFFCIDPSSNSKTIAGNYQLERFNEGKALFYLNKKGANNDDGGVLEATVEKIGWDKNKIYVKKYSSYRGNPDGWVIVDITSGAISSVLDESAFLENYLPKGVELLSSENAWEKLR